MLFVYEFLINHVYKYLWIKYEQHILICIFISKKIHINILIINSIITNILITLIYLYIYENNFYPVTLGEVYEKIYLLR